VKGLFSGAYVLWLQSIRFIALLMTVIKVCIVIWVTCAMQMFVYHEIGNDALMKWREKSVNVRY
jgi:hypothetical protein